MSRNSSVKNNDALSEGDRTACEVSHFYHRWGTPILAILLLLLPLAWYGDFQLQGTNRNNVADWLPKDNPETRKLRWTVQRFTFTIPITIIPARQEPFDPATGN